jgi:hypothetical protein
MSPAAASGSSKAASLDLKKALLETLAINEKANQLFLGTIADTRFGGTAGSAASK